LGVQPETWQNTRCDEVPTNAKLKENKASTTRSRTMARSLVIEEEHGTFTGHRHTHNGYYAGDFSNATTATNIRTRSVRSQPQPTAITGARFSVVAAQHQPAIMATAHPAAA
jgi:hypothetical protein